MSCAATRSLPSSAVFIVEAPSASVALRYAPFFLSSRLRLTFRLFTRDAWPVSLFICFREVTMTRRPSGSFGSVEEMRLQAPGSTPT